MLNNIEKKYKIYVYTNKINNKKYVGQTCVTLYERAEKNGIGYKNCSRFWNAIQKYGWENFEPEILYDNLTKEEADTLEIQTIASLHTQNDKYGYNIRGGGQLPSYYLCKPVVQLDLECNYITSYPSAKDASRMCHICASGICRVCNSISDYKNSSYRKAGNYLWMWEEDYINHKYDKDIIINTLNKEFVHPHARPIVQLSLNMEFIAKFKNISDAARKTGFNRTSINDVCCHRLTNSYGYIWMYESEYENQKFDKEKIIYNAKRRGKEVVQLDTDLNFIKKFASTADAARQTGIDRTFIADTCKGRYSKAKGYKFMYAYDYEALKMAS